MRAPLEKLWIDDIRTPPDDGWVWATNSEQAILVLNTMNFKIASFDHDLGGDDTTRKVILWLCEHEDKWPKECYVHSMNNVGREWLLGMIDRYHVVKD